MIKSLRRKFILINMALISAMLIVVFVALTVVNYRQTVSDTEMALEQAVEMDMRQGDQLPPFIFDEDRGREVDLLYSTPVFTVTIKPDGDLEVSALGNFSVTDDMAAEAVEAVLEAGQESGTLGGLDLRYLVRTTPEGEKIAFADTSAERSAMLQFLLSAAVVGALSLLIIFLLSLFLSELAIRPTRQAWEQQRQFVANASHELKTPITVILANTEILLGHRDSPVADQVKWINSTKDEAMQMKGLVEDLLYLAKTDGETRPETMEPVALSDLVWQYTLPFEAVAFEHQVSLTTEIAPNLRITGDPGEMRQLIGILLDNACKYAGEGGRVTVRLRAEADRVHFSVGNSGPPIPPEDVQHIFERFYRADKSRVGGGYGLGLAIAKTIVEAHHGGKLTVASSETEGTVFTAVFPAKPSISVSPRTGLGYNGKQDKHRR